MAKAYSEDLREKVIFYLASGSSKRETARVFNLGEATIYRWVKLEEAGDVRPKKRTQFPSKVDLEVLRRYVEEHADHTLKEIGGALGLGAQTVWRSLKRLNITRKKRRLFTKSAARRSV